MTLNTIPSHPSSLCYVLKLHRDSRPEHGQICGLLEHVASGQATSFNDAGSLISVLLAHAALRADQSPHHSGQEPL